MASFLLCCIIASLGAVSSTESSLRGLQATAPQSGPAAGDPVDVGGAHTSAGSSAGQTDVSGVNKNNNPDCSGRRLEGEAAAGGTGAAAGTSVRTSDECVENNKGAGDALGTVVGVVIAANAFVGLVLCGVMYVRRGKFWQDPPEMPVDTAGTEKKVGEPTTLGVAESTLAGS